jgi:protein SCO1
MRHIASANTRRALHGDHPRQFEIQSASIMALRRRRRTRGMRGSPPRQKSSFRIPALFPALALSYKRLRGFPAARALATALAVTLATALAGCSHDSGAPWQLTDVSGHLPDLRFSLTDDTGKTVDAHAFHGDTALVYFGYTHCPDVCPETMARLMQVLGKLGSDAQHVRILFITVDPARDTPKALHDYVGAFDAQHAIGLTGTDSQIEGLAKRYRVAYQMEQRDPNGDYEVTHSSAIYVFDADGHARLLATDNDSPDVIAHDLRRVIDASTSDHAST